MSEQQSEQSKQDDHETRVAIDRVFQKIIKKLDEPNRCRLLLKVSFGRQCVAECYEYHEDYFTGIEWCFNDIFHRYPIGRYE